MSAWQVSKRQGFSMSYKKSCRNILIDLTRVPFMTHKVYGALGFLSVERRTKKLPSGQFFNIRMVSSLVMLPQNQDTSLSNSEALMISWLPSSLLIFDKTHGFEETF